MHVVAAAEYAQHVTHTCGRGCYGTTTSGCLGIHFPSHPISPTSSLVERQSEAHSVVTQCFVMDRPVHVHFVTHTSITDLRVREAPSCQFSHSYLFHHRGAPWCKTGLRVR